MHKATMKIAPKPGRQAEEYSRRLASLSSRKRKQAEDEICAMGDAGRNLLIEIMRIREAKPANYPVYWILYFISIVVCSCTAGAIGRGKYGDLWSIAGSAGTTSFWTLLALQRLMYAKTNTAAILANHFRDVAIIPPMSEALNFRDRRTRTAASEALIDLLPCLQTEDEVELTRIQRNNLHRTLHGKNRDLVLSVLRGLRFVGDSSSISDVQSLAEGLELGAGDDEVKEAACGTLMLLRQRAERARSQATLLRASATPSPAPAELLRAAGDSTTDQTVLLRASAGRDGA